MTSALWVPDTAKPKHQCQVPRCGEQFYDTDKYLRHVPKCAEAHRSRLLEASEEKAEIDAANPLISGEAFDKEALEWVERRRRGD